MKKLVVLLVLGLFIFPISNISSINTKEDSLATSNFEKGEDHESSEDIHNNNFNVVENIAPFINEAVNSYYGRNRFVDFENLKLIDFKSLHEKNYSYEVVLQVDSCEPDGKAPYGVERVTVRNDLGNVKISNYIHISTSQKSKKTS